MTVIDRALLQYIHQRLLQLNEKAESFNAGLANAIRHIVKAIHAKDTTVGVVEDLNGIMATINVYTSGVTLAYKALPIYDINQILNQIEVIL